MSLSSSPPRGRYRVTGPPTSRREQLKVPLDNIHQLGIRESQELVRTEFGALSGVMFHLLTVLGRVSLTASPSGCAVAGALAAVTASGTRGGR